MFHQGHRGSVYEPDPGADQSALELVRVSHVLEGDEGHPYHSIYLLKSPQGSPPWRTAKEKDHSGYTLLPDGSAA